MSAPVVARSDAAERHGPTIVNRTTLAASIDCAFAANVLFALIARQSNAICASKHPTGRIENYPALAPVSVNSFIVNAPFCSGCRAFYAFLDLTLKTALAPMQSTFQRKAVGPRAGTLLLWLPACRAGSAALTLTLKLPLKLPLTLPLKLTLTLTLTLPRSHRVISTPSTAAPSTRHYPRLAQSVRPMLPPTECAPKARSPTRRQQRRRPAKALSSRSHS